MYKVLTMKLILIIISERDIAAYNIYNIDCRTLLLFQSEN